MSLIRWRPEADFFSLRKSMDKLLNDFFAPFESQELGGLAPALDVLEDKTSFIVKMEIPGIKRENIEVTVEEGVLTIRGEKKQEAEEKGKNFHRVERRYGTFSRSIALPGSVITDKIKANYKDGILTINIPKKEEAKAKQINITVES